MIARDWHRSLPISPFYLGELDSRFTLAKMSMPPHLSPLRDLSPLQHAQLLDIELLPEQRMFAGDIESELHILRGRSHPDVCGLALLVEEVPKAFLLLKRGELLPPWARRDAATVHALQIDRRAQRCGLGRLLLTELPATVRALWPQVHCLQLSVDEQNTAALGLYRALGWTVTGNGYRAAIGFERQLTLAL